MRKITLALSLFLLLGAGCLSQESALTSEVDTPSEALPVLDDNQSWHAVSVPALMATDFDGRDFEVGEVLAYEDAYTRYAISYMSGELRITGIMNVPTGDGPFALLMLNHGYIDPAIYTTGRGLKREQDYFARDGFVVIHSDYRNHAGSDDDADYQLTLRLGYAIDVANAIVAVTQADLPYIDTDRVGMFGHSMGGGIAQAIAVAAPELVDAIILYAPVSGDAWENYEQYTSRRADESDLILEAYGDRAANADFWREASAATYYDQVDDAVMIHIGTLDDSTPPAWSYAIAEQLEDLQKDVTLHVYENERHEFGSQWSEMMRRSAEFFKSELDLVQ
ncbi:alpha/beta fold hydrolase [Patescibacteria group bacterium]|nr:alpha/beta fold hydrolase [Patescibacteria group bacterium]